MLQIMPDWFYGFVPPGWWPDRPREPFFWSINLLPMVAGASTSIEQVFDKRRDVLVYGGCALVSVGTGIACPAGGTFSRILCRLSNPAGNVTFTDGNIIGAGAGNLQPGFVLLESLFSAWQFLSLRAAYWPIPIAIPKGGSLQMDLTSLAAADLDVRIAFWTATLYEEREYAA